MGEQADRINQYFDWDDSEDVEVGFDAKKAETEHAVLFDFGGDRHWIPKSQIVDMRIKSGGSRFKEKGGTVTIPGWLAREKGLD